MIYKRKKTNRTNKTKKVASGEREKKVISRWNRIAVIFGLWFLFFPIPYRPLIVINILIPILAIYFAIKYKDVCVARSTNIKYPLSFGTMVFMPSLALAVRGAFDYEIDYTVSFWIYVVMLVIISLLIIFKSTTWKLCYSAPRIVITIYVMLYCVGVVQQVNCGLLTIDKNVYDVEVLDKYVSNGKVTNYYIYLEPFGKYTERQRVDVLSDTYNKVPVHKKVKAITYRGVLGIDWYKVDFNNTK